MERTRVAIADDNQNILEALKDVIDDEEDMTIVGTADNGADTVTMIKESRPDIVLLDLIMPGIDGIETAEILLKSDPSATILMLSSLCDTGTLEEVRAIGVKYLIPKPWEDDVLLATLELLKKHREESQQENNNKQA